MAPEGQIKLTFLGDISLNDAYRDMVRSGGEPFKNVGGMVNESDLVIGNLECLLEGDGENTLKSPRLKTDLETLKLVKELNLGLATLAHNHVYDNLESGFANTVNWLEENDIQYTGASLNKEELHNPRYINIKGFKIAFLNFVTEDTNPKMPEGAKVYPNIFSEDIILQKMQEAKSGSDFVVLLLHWGGKVDYGYYPHHEQVAQAKNFIKAGADLIVGHHSHTFQVHSSIGDKLVFYSLGNFCFADIITGKKVSPIRNSGKVGGVVQINIHPLTKKYKAKILPTVNEELMIRQDTTKLSKFRWRQFKFLFIRYVPLCKDLYYFYLKRIEPLKFYSEQSDKSIWQKLVGLNWRKIRGFAAFAKK